MSDIIKEIDKLIEERANGFISESKTYQEALRNAKNNGLIFKYGVVGKFVDDGVRGKIEQKALEQPIAKDTNHKRPIAVLEVNTDVLDKSFLQKVKARIRYL